MSWHPTKQVLAVGWKSGEVTFYSHQDQMYHEQTSMHRAPISALLWNKSGKRLVSCDGEGLLAVWTTDQRGFIKTTPSYHYRLQNPITHCSLHSSNRYVGIRTMYLGLTYSLYPENVECTHICKCTCYVDVSMYVCECLHVCMPSQHNKLVIAINCAKVNWNPAS